MSVSLTKIACSDLVVGMYVSQLDRPWVDTPFPLQGFHIKSQSDAEKVQNFCKHVFIDTERSRIPEDKKPQHQITKKSSGAQKTRKIGEVKLRSVKYTNPLPLESELVKGREVYSEIEDLFTESLNELQQGKRFDIKRSQHVVKQITESVIRNPDALVWLSKMKASHGESYNHAIRASVLAASFGVHLGMKQEAIELLTLAVLLCDIGIAKLPKDVLLLAKKIEFDDIPEYKMHITLTLDILDQTPNLPPEIIPIVEAHHERLDGSGYPFCLSGNQIPILAQIAGLVDEFDRLTSSRSMTSQLTPADGASTIYKMRDGAFNEQLVEEFIKAVGIYPAGTLVELNSKEVCMVISQNPERKLLPKVLILKDKDGKIIDKKPIVDLYQRSLSKSGQNIRINKSLIDNTIPLDYDALTQGFSAEQQKKGWSIKKLFSNSPA